MPSQILHLIFAREVLDLPSSPALDWGAQGPDLYYHNRRTRPSALPFSSRLHQRGFGLWMARWTEVLAGSELAGDPGWILFTRAFGTHAFLDRALHPYVASRAGPPRERPEAHAFVERLLDRAWPAPGEAPPGPVVPRGVSEGPSGGAGWAQTAAGPGPPGGTRSAGGAPEPWADGDSWAEGAVWAAQAWHRHLNAEPGLDPRGWGLWADLARSLWPGPFGTWAGTTRFDHGLKDALGYYRWTDPARPPAERPGHPRARSQFHPWHRPPGDWLNLSRASWLDPVTGQERRHSVFELWGPAAAQARAADSLWQQLWGAGGPYEALSAVYGTDTLNVADAEGRSAAPRWFSPWDLDPWLG